MTVPIHPGPEAPPEVDLCPHTKLAAALALGIPTLEDHDLRAYWEEYVLAYPKGRQPPKATFLFGALSDCVMERLEAKAPTWSTVANRVLMPTDVITHWASDRRQALYRIVDGLGLYIRSATHVVPGNQPGKEWLQPLLLTEAPNGMVVPLGLLPSDEGILVRSLIAPVTPHRIKKLRKLGG